MIHSGFLNFGVDVFFLYICAARQKILDSIRRNDPLNWYHCLRIKCLQKCVN